MCYNVAITSGCTPVALWSVHQSITARYAHQPKEREGKEEDTKHIQHSTLNSSIQYTLHTKNMAVYQHYKIMPVPSPLTVTVLFWYSRSPRVTRQTSGLTPPVTKKQYKERKNTG